MKLFSICLAILTLVLPNTVDAQNELQPQIDATTLDKKLELKVDKYLNAAVDYGIYSGAVLLVRDGKVVLRKAYGFANFQEQKRFEINTRTKLMSVTKVFTATAIAKLAQEGKLKTSDRVADHLPNFPKAWQKVTLRQLLSHTSKIPNCAFDWTKLEEEQGGRGIGLWPELAKRLADRKLVKRATYSNFNYILLGLVIEKISGRSWPEYVQKHVFTPSSMTATGIDNGSRFDELAMGYFLGASGVPKPSYQDMSRIQAAGGAYSTVDDLYRFDRILYTNKVLTKAARKKMFEPVTDYFSEGWSLFSVVPGHRCVSHSGGANGYVADFLRFPDDNACVIVTSNLAFSPIGSISRDLARILFDKPVKPFVGPSEKMAKAWAGVYVFEKNDKKHRILIRNNKRLLIGFEIREGQSRISGRIMLSRGNNEYELPYSGWRIQFKPRAESSKFDVLITGRDNKKLVAKREPDINRKWKGSVGTFQSDSGQTATIKSVDNSLTLSAPGIFAGRVTLTPLSETKALAFYNQLGGNVVSIDGKADAANSIEIGSVPKSIQFKRK